MISGMIARPERRSPTLTRRRARTLFALMWLALSVAPLPAFSADALHCPPLARTAPATTPIPYGEGLLWKVERGSAPVSHLFGTMHVSDPEIIDLPEPVQTAFDGSRSLVLEARFDAEGIAEFATLMHYDEGTELATQMSAPLYARTQELLQRYGIPPAVARIMRPWAAFVTLNQPVGNIGLPLDLMLMHNAMLLGLPVHGLETLREQADVLASFSLADQIALLHDTVCYFNQIQLDIDELKRLYVDRDLGAIVRLAQQYPGRDPGLGKRAAAAIIDRRNDLMAARMRTYLDGGGAFIAVGALHLPGEGGVLTLLVRQGYRITRVY